MYPVETSTNYYYNTNIVQWYQKIPQKWKIAISKNTETLSICCLTKDNQHKFFFNKGKGLTNRPTVRIVAL